ncbi:MAG: hypothetical protein J5594_05690 [Elusimicrobiaceae bacterium]|nr:hypothetical protein [Elusimicrobiaceae bacterium]MBR4151746.1 hypothetical protein [Selenomonadaceae bacterium]
MNLAEIQNKLKQLKETQSFEKPLDFTRSFVAKAGEANTFAIPITNEGPFLQESYNIICTRNSVLKRTYKGVTTTENVCCVKLKFKSQADNASQSNDYIPVGLIGTPGFADSPRYGSRPFFHLYPKGDVLLIEYDNRAPESLIHPTAYFPSDGDEYEMNDELVQICFNGKIYPLGA